MSSLDKAFICPHCHSYAYQQRSVLYVSPEDPSLARTPKGKLGEIMQVGSVKNCWEMIGGTHLTVCISCSKATIWAGDTTLYPASLPSPEVHPDTPEDIRADYNEARKIHTLSPRGAAALLRLALQKLLAQLGGRTGSIDGDIRALASNGLHPHLISAMDVVRITGNEAVHPGEMDLRDNVEIVNNLFQVFNIIVDQMISGPKKIATMYAGLPASKTAAAEQKDASALKKVAAKP